MIPRYRIAIVSPSDQDAIHLSVIRYSQSEDSDNPQAHVLNENGWTEITELEVFHPTVIIPGNEGNQVLREMESAIKRLREAHGF